MSMLMESQTLPDIQGKTLEFCVEIRDCQFNRDGWYYLILTIHNSFTKDFSQTHGWKTMFSFLFGTVWRSNRDCWYYLILTIHNSFTKDFSQVKVMSGDDGPWQTKRQIQTDYTKQEESSPLSFFKDKKFTYRLPRGFCKNDKNHDVYLLVEAFRADTSGGEGRKVGEGKFAIYPRNNAPRVKLYVDQGDDYYNFTGVMSLLRTNSTDNIQMHCGRIRNNYSLHELVPPKPKSPPPPPVATPPTIRLEPTPSPAPSPTPRSFRLDPPPSQRTLPPKTESTPIRQGQKPPTPSSWGDNLSLDITMPKSPPLPPATDGRKIPETPLQDDDKQSFYTDRSYKHVANVGKEHIEVICHGSSTLPLTSDGQVPRPYAVVKTQTDDNANRRTGVTTHASVRPTHAPSWEEMVTLPIDENFAEDETLVVSVADAPSQRSLVDYKIPVAHLTPFHQYHLEFNMPSDGNPSGVKQFVSLTRKLPRLPRDPACPNYLALEVLLMNVQKPIRSPMGPLIAVARIVPDYYNYKSDNLLSQPRNAGVTMNNVTFPAAHPSNFVVTERSQHGHPQLSLPGRPDEQPRWMHPYLFVEKRDKDTLFTSTAALVIEYYVASMAMSDQFWRMQYPIAFSSMLMDEEMYKQLTDERARNGLRINNVPMQGSELTTLDGERPTVGVILRLITTETPDSMVSVSNLDDIPTLDLYPSEVPSYYRSNSPEGPEPPLDVTKGETKPETPLSPARTPRTPPNKPNPGRYILQKVKKRPMSPVQDGMMPNYDAMDTVLPEYQYIFQPGDGPQPSARQPKPGPSVEPDDLDKSSFHLIDHQHHELDNYRSAVKKMGGDMLTLQTTIRDLEKNNHTLRQDLAHYNDTSKLMADSSELDGLSKQDVLSRYATMKQTLTKQTIDLKDYKTKLQHVQNDLIQKNDQEKEYLRMQKAHSTQQQMIQRLQEKLRKMKILEQACKKQEDVIIKMERVLEKHHRDRNKYPKDKAMQEANEALLQENKRLRDEIDELRIQLRNVGSRESDDLERMELYQKLEKAEARIQALERQMAENSRQWGKERAELQVKLNENEHGFGRTRATIFHDFPVLTDQPIRKSSLKALSPVYR